MSPRAGRADCLQIRTGNWGTDSGVGERRRSIHGRPGDEVSVSRDHRNGGIGVWMRPVEAAAWCTCKRVTTQSPHQSASSISFAWNSQGTTLVHAQGYAECRAGSVRCRTFRHSGARAASAGRLPFGDTCQSMVVVGASSARLITKKQQADQRLSWVKRSSSSQIPDSSDLPAGTSTRSRSPGSISAMATAIASLGSGTT